MKVLSIQQPWASLIVAGHKKIETRSWNTKFRGEVLIHASAAMKPDNRAIMLDFQQQYFNLQLPNFESLPFGAIIGKANLCWTVSSEYCFEGNEFEDKGLCFKITDQELAFGDYSPGRFGWLLSDVVKFETPIPAKGQLGFWNYEFKTKE